MKVREKIEGWVDLSSSVGLRSGSRSPGSIAKFRGFFWGKGEEADFRTAGLSPPNLFLFIGLGETVR